MYGWTCNSNCVTCGNCPTDQDSTEWDECDEGVIGPKPTPVSRNVFTVGPSNSIYAGTNAQTNPAPAPAPVPGAGPDASTSSAAGTTASVTIAVAAAVTSAAVLVGEL